LLGPFGGVLREEEEDCARAANEPFGTVPPLAFAVAD
jgi:hypothetical protein